MPLVVRYVEPRSVCASPLLNEEATRSGDALQAVAVRAMAGVIRQLSSLARHAEGVMGELADSLANCHSRTLELERRTRILRADVLPNLDPDREVLEGFEIPHPNHQFKSSKTTDQRLLMQKHAPAALLEQYGQAQPPPALGEFDKDWDEVRNASHLYSNPNFFFESWRDEIQRQTLRKISHMDLLSPSRDGANDGKHLLRASKHKRALEHSTGSDKVSSFVRPVKRTFSLSRKPHPQRHSIHGSTQSLNTDPGYHSMPGHARTGVSRRSSPSFHSVRHYHPSASGTIARSQSLRSKPKKRPKLSSLSRATAAVYVEQPLEVAVPATTLEESAEYYEYREAKPIKRSMSLRMRSHSHRRSRSKSPIPPTSTNSVLDTVHMYTVAQEVARHGASMLATLSKHHLQCLDLGVATFETYLTIEPLKKENTTFRAPVGIKRLVSSLDVQLVAMRSDGTASYRASALRLQRASVEVKASEGGKPELSTAMSSSQGNIALVNLHRRISLLSPPAVKARPMSASFVDPPTVRMFTAASRTSLRSHGGSLTDLTRMEDMARMSNGPTSPQSPSSKLKPRRPAPPAPPRSSSRASIEGPDSGHSTPKASQAPSPLVSHSTTSSSPSPSNETPSGGGIPNGRISPNPLLKELKEQRGSPIQRNVSSPQLLMNPIQEEEVMTANHVNSSYTQHPGGLGLGLGLGGAQNIVGVPKMMVFSPVTNRPIPRVFERQESLYISPRKQSLTVESIENNIANIKRLRASQILQTGGIRGGDLSSSRLDLLEAIRKGIQLKDVQKRAQEKESRSVCMPWDVAAILERRLALELDTDSSDNDSAEVDWEDD